VVPVSYHDFFGGCATVAGALIGLLFVAISVSPGRLAGSDTYADHQVKAGTAFSALVNTLVIALVSLLPRANLSASATILAAAGLSSTAGLIIVMFRSSRYRDSKKRIRLDQLAVLVALLVLYGLQLANGIQLGGSPGNLGRISSQGGLCIGFFVFAIGRSWELVGAPSSHLLAAIAGMAHRPADPDAPAVPDDQAGKSESAPPKP
jgi:hypothetical protein